MPISPILPALVAGALALSGCSKVDQAFDDKVRAYLLDHPEVIQEAIDKLQAKQAAQAATEAKLAIGHNQKAIEQDPRDFVANPTGKITVTEFYDYRCPHCVSAAPAVLSMIQANPDIRVVFKEFPIFGAASDRAAMGAIAVKRAGGDYLAVYREFMAARPLDDAAIDRILTAHGVAPASLEDPLLKAQATEQLASVRHLAVSLGIDGTPAFIVGHTLIPGEDMDGVRAAIADERAAQGAPAAAAPAAPAAAPPAAK
jgi:protein-disulfide isomerase